MAGQYQPLEPAARFARDRRLLAVYLDDRLDEIELFDRTHPIRESRMDSVR